MRKFFLSNYILLLAVVLSAQDRELGNWKMYLPYSSTTTLDDGDDRVYVASSQSVFSYNKQDGAIQTLDKSTGLSDVGIRVIRYYQEKNILAIAYNNSNLDLIFNHTDVYNISTFKNLNTSSSISINGIYFNGNNAYVCTDLGISVLDLTRKEVSNSYTIGNGGTPTKVFDVTISGGYIYAATLIGVKRAPLNNVNLLNFENWKLFTAADSLPAKYAPFVWSINNHVFTVINDSIYKLRDSTWSKIYFNPDDTVSMVRKIGNMVYLSTWVSTGGTKFGMIDTSGSLRIRYFDGQPRNNGWFENGDVVYAADVYSGFRKIQYGSFDKIIPDGPFTDKVFDIALTENRLYVAPGGVDESWGFTFNQDGVFVRENDKWSYLNKFSDPIMDGFFDFITAVNIPSRNKTYFGSHYTGMIELDEVTKNLVSYTQFNSPLERTEGDEERTKISCMARDKYDNLWISNEGALSLIKVLKNDGTWKKIAPPISFSLMKKMIFDRNNRLWAPLRPKGILVVDYGADVDNTADDKYRLLLAGSGIGGLPEDNVNCLAEDKEGNIWVGTNAGIGVYYCASSIFSQNGCDASQIKVERDGYIGYLFGTETVRAIAVDAANRKWIGTTNGLWLISADGKTELLRFNTENSPLPSNQITDIEIDPKTGEVFIGTLSGLLSYQGDAIKGLESGCEALAYPNPVRPEYNGPIAVKGLVDNAFVKITDATGTLIIEGRANGGQFIWNGKGYSGNRANSGVYTVYSSDDLGKNRCTAKILIMN
jgi:hypothetical protein